MSIADKLLQVNQVKQDIKTAIETKGVPMTNVAFTEYANKILDISGGGGEVDEYFYYSKAYYTITNNSTLFLNAWQDSKNESWIVEDEIYNIKLTQAYSNIELLPDVPVDIYTGDGLDDLFDDLENGIFFELGKSYFISGDKVIYYGDIKDALELPVSVYTFNDIFSDPTAFLIGDISTFGIPGVSYALIRIASNPNKDFILTLNLKYKTNGIIIPENWESIEENSFNGDSNYTEKVETNNLEELDVPLIIPNSVSSIGIYAFNGWKSNNHPLVIPDSVTSIGGHAFRYWEANNQPLTIPDSVTTIGDYAFAEWFSNNQPLVIPESVTYIDSYAFYNWTANNQPLVIPNSVSSIGSGAFRGWSSNNQPLVIPNSMTEIGDSAFRDWTANDKPLTIPSSVTTIGNWAFYEWLSNNQPLVIPNSVTSIGSNVFGSWSSNNHQLVIPDSVTSIESHTFRGWTSNDQPLVIPDSVTTIGDYAFAEWFSNNQPLIIPNSVTSIGGSTYGGAFSRWSNVPYVEIQAITPPSLGHASAFANQNDAPIYVPDESVDDYKTATNWVNLASRIFSINDK